MGIEIAGIGLIWYGVAAAAATGISMGTAAYTSSQEAKQQKKLLQAQEDAVKAAENKAAAAKSLASQEASEKLKKQRLAQTNTILTSPLGVTGEATTTSNTLGG
jgi:hypothetical protein